MYRRATGWHAMTTLLLPRSTETCITGRTWRVQYPPCAAVRRGFPALEPPTESRWSAPPKPTPIRWLRLGGLPPLRLVTRRQRRPSPREPPGSSRCASHGRPPRRLDPSSGGRGSPPGRPPPSTRARTRATGRAGGSACWPGRSWPRSGRCQAPRILWANAPPAPRDRAASHVSAARRMPTVLSGRTVAKQLAQRLASQALAACSVLCLRGAAQTRPGVPVRPQPGDVVRVGRTDQVRPKVRRPRSTHRRS